MQPVKIIAPQATYAVRQAVLRPGKPIEACHFDGDALTTTFHFGYFDGSSIVGVASVYEVKNALFEDERQLQLRGMAVLESRRGQKIGEALVQFSENWARENDFDLVWFNARESAVGFYAKNGYEIHGERFMIADVGMHYIMFKTLGQDSNPNR